MVNIKVGDKAPDFTLPDTEMKEEAYMSFWDQKLF